MPATFRNELVVQGLAQAAHHQALDDRHHSLTLGLGFVDEADAHARLLLTVGLLGLDRPLYPSMKFEWLIELRNLELEHELGADAERLLRADEHAVAANVACVVRKEGIEALVL